MSNNERHIILIDAHSLIHRCFHAVPPLTNPRGEPVGALYGVSNVLLKIIAQKKIDYIAALFDRPEPTFRKEKFNDYKIHRPKASDELIAQLIEAHSLFSAFSIPCFELPGYEGDDLIGTCVELFKREPNTTITILTGDMDSLQLVDDTESVEVETFKKGISDVVVYHEQEVFERLGVRPDQVVDYKALVGDASDNIPGVPGVGPKTASTILQTYDTLETYFATGERDKSYTKICEHKDLALLSQELARIDVHVPIQITLNELRFTHDTEQIKKYFTQQGFISLLKRLETKEVSETKREIKDEEKKEPILTTTLFDAPNTPEPIHVALLLLGFKDLPWQEYAQLIFKEELPYQEYIEKITLWISRKIEAEKLFSVYENIELPLIPILKEMRARGIAVDKEHLQRLHIHLDEAIQIQEKKVREQAGNDINLNSPKQVLEFLKTKCGAKIKSTSADTLDKIKEQIPWVSDLLTYREFFKLQSTYVTAFEKLIAPDGRIHPTFLQLGAATGRMSCQNPNLQNIPQESIWSTEIRNMFVAPKGYSLVACDYSQIELRVLASLAQDTNMIQAFHENKDIHTITAQKIFNTTESEVTKQMRRTAKTLNFGMVYGMGFRALAQQSGLSTDEAKEFIAKYFIEFSAVKRWQENILTCARTTGRVTTATGRFRTLTDIHSSNGFFASQAEREAINMPVQGLAADILKLAMIRVSTYIQKNNVQKQVRIILTIHDELIFEIDDELLAHGKESQIIKDIKHEMESAYVLDVPIKTEVSVGKRWGELN
ncbi:MAG: DNA polymerase [Candidatus Paceibacterota bacterium]